MFKEIKYAYQRIKNGYSDRDCWNINYHLAEIIPKMMRKLKGGMGCPSKFYDNNVPVDNCKNWDLVLERIAQGFEAFTEMDNPKYQWKVVEKDGGKVYTKEIDYEKDALLKIKFDEGMKLFAENFMGLWN